MTEDWKPLKRSEIPLISNVEMDALTAEVIRPFDYVSLGEEEFYPYEIPSELLDWTDYNIGVIVGASGTGKSKLLSKFVGGEDMWEPSWEEGKSIASHFNSPQDAVERLSASGLMSVPDWVKPFDVLSNGQKFRANLARKLYDAALIDEFTSVVDRNVAKSASVSMSRYVRSNNVKGIVIATCHRDILEFLEPDWIIDTDRGEWTSGRYLRRPEMVLEIYPCSNEVWSLFSSHHYLTENLNKASHCYLAVWETQVVGFYSVMSYPSGTVQNAYRGHRLVILPDYQGFGFGHTIAEAVAQHYLDNGKRFFAKTSHPRLGEYRDSSPLWRGTSKNHMRRTDKNNNGRTTRWQLNPERWSYSHEYVGKENPNT